ncbi:MAG: ADP-ribosylglycohydrolase family protein [Nocardioidaceae bacterium]
MPEPLTIRERIHATVAGLSAADAVTWTSWWHRMSQLPPRREVRLGEAWEHNRAELTTSLPTPYLQSSSPSLIDPAGPTDDAEWFVVAVRHHLGQRLDGTQANQPYEVWHELAARRSADPDSVRGRVGTAIGLANLSDGATPPTSGHDNPHHFDDMACVRAVAAGLVRPGDPTGAAELAEVDAAVTHSLDGVWGARAYAALISSLVGGAGIPAATSAALHELPADSWCAHVAAEFLGAATEPGSVMELAARLEREVVDHVYAYSTQAPETLGLLLAHLSAAADGTELLLGALCHPRHGDSLAPLAGAVAGAAYGLPTAPLPTLGGVCVRDLAGVSLESIVDTLCDGVTLESTR